MAQMVTIVVCLCALIVQAQCIGFDGINTPPYKWCGRTSPPKCCPGVGHIDFPNRDDECTVDIEIPVHGPHMCYCDEFCDRTSRGGDKDCCPDWEEVCKGIVTPEPLRTGECKDQSGNQWRAGETVTMNCWTCECSPDGWSNCQPNDIKTHDPDSSCLIQPRILEEHKINRYKWRATNYTQFWGKTLKDGLVFRLGTMRPDDLVKKMNDIKIIEKPPIPAQFDAREEWPQSISGVFDQENCGSSWAFSTISVAADRNAIMANKAPVQRLSAQNLLSCNQLKQRGCDGGNLDRAWYWMRQFGIVDESCYPYQSGRSNKPGACQISMAQYKDGGPVTCPSGSREGKVYRITPPYKVKSEESEIQAEIVLNGPVQATFRVYEDFFHYQSGVYRKMPLVGESDDPDRSGYHSVKILGFGEEAGEKYWLCQNSWGTNWGEQGLFKIVRGENHCEIESFVIGAVGYRAKKKKRKMRKLRRRKLLF